MDVITSYSQVLIMVIIMLFFQKQYKRPFKYLVLILLLSEIALTIIDFRNLAKNSRAFTALDWFVHIFMISTLLLLLYGVGLM